MIIKTFFYQYLKHCDEIMVMENGEFVEQGKHDDLITLNGYYSSMMKQFHQSTDNPTRATSMCSILILSQKNLKR